MHSATLQRITHWREATEASMSTAGKDLAAEAGPSKFQYLVQVVGHEPAAHIQRKLGEFDNERPRDDDSERSEVDWEDPNERENEIYIIALSAALQRHHDRDPAYVEKMLRHALREAGFCTESCKAYFLVSYAATQPGLAR